MKTKMKLLVFAGVTAIFLSFAFKPISDKKIIVIDAGHGGKDLGATIDGEQEKLIVENIAQKINKLNQNNTVEIILLRQGDNYLELKERIDKTNSINPSLFISLHINSSKNRDDNGTCAYVSNKNDFYDQSLYFAKNLLESMSGINLAKGEVKDGNFYVIKNAKCPAVLLEIGYLSNPEDNKFISSENGQNEIAVKIFDFINQ